MRVIDGAIRLSAATLPRIPEKRRPPQPARLSLVDRWLGRREPSTFARCLAVHIQNAGPRSALS